MRYFVVIPAFNAAETIAELIRRIQGILPSAGILVVDDGSSDSSGALAREAGADVLTHSNNRGKGEALKTAFAEALRLGADAVIQLDADLQHDPAYLPEFTKQFEESKTDIIIGTRDFNVGGMPWDRRLTNWLTSYAITKMGGVRVEDSQSGYRLLSRRALETVDAPTSNYDYESEYLILAGRAGLTIGSVPISTIYEGQKSSIHKWTDTKRFLRLVRKYWRTRP
jgi:glycosyltransferase involved in cell wall biosynthesis